MNKLLIGILTVLVIIAGLVLKISLVLDKQPQPLLGNIAGTIESVASSTATYFGTNEGTRTATGTLLTLQTNGVQSLSLGVQLVATTTTGTIYAQVDGSFDASTWYGLNFPVIGSGSAIANLNQAANGTGLITWTPTSATNFNALIPLESIDARYVRVRAWTTGTSTLLIEGFKNVNN